VLERLTNLKDELNRAMKQRMVLATIGEIRDNEPIADELNKSRRSRHDDLDFRKGRFR